MAQVEKQAAHPQEGPSTFAPRRATPRECRRSSSSSRVLSPILALSSVTCRCCTWRWEYRVMREILLLQVAAKNYNKTPRSDLGPGSRTWSCSTRMSEAGQELGEGRGGFSLLASPESLSQWPPGQPQALWHGDLWDTQTPTAEVSFDQILGTFSFLVESLELHQL
ncbi:uncharacterized protein LOC131402210 isoform X5 [Diceros bicornis minor]|nr:uncharacterized protein LOC131402210 isoform X5 [Diceros bicornis minor]